MIIDKSVTLWVAALLMVGACDRKSEAAAPATDETDAAATTVSTTTVTAIGTVPLDAGLDGGEAAVAVVGVSITAIATKGRPTVVEGIARARCEREERCGNVKYGKTYASFDACLTQIATDWRDDLNRYECPGGFDQKELDECMVEIRNEDCGNPFDTLERIIACRSGDICLSTR